MSVLDGLKLNYRLFGTDGVFLTAKSRLFGKPREIEVVADGFGHPIHLRLRTTDISLYEEIILNNEYSFSPSKSPQTIIDAGANIGLTSIFFANKFPQAKILAIEPEQSNFQVLKKNTAYYPNIFPIYGALWREEMVLHLENPGTGNWGYQTQEQQAGEMMGDGVPAMTVDKLMGQHGFEYVDILKIDIEGSEKEVFETPSAWIDRVGVIIVELHDHFKNGCTRSVYAATNNFEFERRQGETIFFVRDGYLPIQPERDPETNGKDPAIINHPFRSRIVHSD